MAKIQNPLRPAYHGYIYQDLVVSYVFAKSLIHRYTTVTVDEKIVEDDKIDDVEVSYAGKRIRRQIKSSEDRTKCISISDFVNERSSLRIDRLIQTYLQAGDRAADEYRLCATWQLPKDDELLKYLETIEVSHTISEHNSLTFRLRSESIWPQNGPISNHWVRLEGQCSREQFLSFCERFVIELNLPSASYMLNNPGYFEKSILDLMVEIGIGRYPNEDRSSIDVSALLFSLASAARAKGLTLTPSDIEDHLNLRTDYGHIAQTFPIDNSVFEDRKTLRPSMVQNVMNSNHQILVGPPGSGKSWELTKLVSDLKEKDVLVARHYCYLEPGDDLVERRIKVEVLFGNLMWDLTEGNEALRGASRRRYSAGIEELEDLLNKIDETGKKAVLIIDGLDHIARVLREARSVTEDDADIVGELATLRIPSRVTLIVGSQPGSHLNELREAWSGRLVDLQVQPWTINETRSLIHKYGVDKSYQKVGGDNLPLVENLILERSEGNPLYATYLSRQLVALSEKGVVVDFEEWLRAAPSIDGNISRYYEYLYRHASAEAKSIADVLGIIDFSVTQSELIEILPAIDRRFVPDALSHLFPILIDIIGQGGIRIFHESFRRFIIDQIVANGGVVRDTLDPVITWLDRQGFYKDAKAYRFLLPALYRAERFQDALSLVDVSFVSKSVAHGHPVSAVERNLALAANIAAHTLQWPDLVRCAELNRSANTCYEDKLQDSISYWEAYADLFGAPSLVDRLLFDGKITQKPDLGLVLCSLANDLGAVPPWKEYLDEYENLQDKDNESKERNHIWENRVSIARLHAVMCLDGFASISKSIVDYLVNTGEEASSKYVRALARQIARSAGPQGIQEVIDGSSGKLSPNLVAILRLGLADELYSSQDLTSALQDASLAIEHLKSFIFASDCISYGASFKNSERAIAIFPKQLSFDFGKHHIDDKTASELTLWVALLRLLSESEKTLLEEEFKKITGEGWYTCWLRFTVLIAQVEGARRNGNGFIDIKKAFDELARDVRPFVGEPRSCDLYNIHNLILETIKRGISLLETEADWQYALVKLKAVIDGTSTSLDRSPSGPLRIEQILEILFPYAGKSDIGPVIRKFVQELVEDWDKHGTYFEYHAERNIFLARILKQGGNRAAALERWEKVGIYLCGYGFRKDVTIYEILDSVGALAKCNEDEALKALAAAQPLAVSLLRHTDGRETKRAQLSWFQSLMELNPSIGLTFLANSMRVPDVMGGWPLESALEDSLSATLNGDSVLLEKLYETIYFEVNYDGDGEKLAKKRLAIIDMISEKQGFHSLEALERLAAQISDDSRHYTDGSKKVWQKFVEENNIKVSSRFRENKDNGDSKDTNSSFKTKKHNSYEPCFPGNTLLDHIAGVRKFSSDWELSDSDRNKFVNAFGYRLCALAEAGKEDEARRLIRLSARTFRSLSAKIHPLNDVAEGLEYRGYGRLAAIAYAFAYVRTRGGGGWKTTGDDEHEIALLRAISLNREEVLQIVAGEIAYLLRHISYQVGITESLIKRSAAWGEPLVAKECWWQAFNVIRHRIPTCIESSGWFERMEVAALTRDFSEDEALIEVLLTRVMHPLLYSKIAALSGLSRLIKSHQHIFSRPLKRFLTQNSDFTSVMLVLEILRQFEHPSYELTKMIHKTIEKYAASNLWGIRSISILLLERAGITPIATAPIDVDGLASATPTPEKTQAILSIDPSERLEKLETLWPNLPQLITSRFDFLYEDNAEINKEKCKDRYEMAYGRDRKARPATPVLLWEAELFERALHEILNGLKAELWKKGIWSEEKEEEILEEVLPALSDRLGFYASRIVRPTYAEPRMLQEGSNEIFILKDDLRYSGWIRAGYFEYQWVRKEGNNYDPPDMKLTVFSGLYAIPLGESLTQDDFPFHRANIKDWWTKKPPQPSISRGLPLGPPIVFDKRKDWLGDMFFLIPPVEMSAYIDLNPPDFGYPLTWKDKVGTDAIVMRTWRVRDAVQHFVCPTEYIGCDLLMRPDIFAKLERLVGINLKQQTVIWKSDVEKV